MNELQAGPSLGAARPAAEKTGISLSGRKARAAAPDYLLAAVLVSVSARAFMYGDANERFIALLIPLAAGLYRPPLLIFSLSPATSAVIMDQSGRAVSTEAFPGSPEHIALRLAGGDNCPAHTSVMFKNRPGLICRDKFRHFEDYDFYLQLLLDGRRPACPDEPLVYYKMAADEPFDRYIRRFYYILFKDLAKDMRRQTGSDPYPRFDPQTLLNINVETTVDRAHLLLLIKLAVGGNYMEEARALLRRRYFRHYGSRPGYAALWLSSFVGGRAHGRLPKLLERVSTSCA
jgi:hypothetical protein